MYFKAEIFNLVSLISCNSVKLIFLAEVPVMLYCCKIPIITAFPPERAVKHLIHQIHCPEAVLFSEVNLYQD